MTRSEVGRLISFSVENWIVLSEFLASGQPCQVRIHLELVSNAEEHRKARRTRRLGC